MFNWLKKLFSKNTKSKSRYEFVCSVGGRPGEEEIDPMMIDVINECWKSGKTVIANRNADGTYEIKEVER